MAVDQKSIFPLFEQVALTQPAKPALIFKKNEQPFFLTYGSVLNKSTAFAEVLTKNHIHKGDKVALVLENQPCFVWLFFGIMKRGAVAVPLDVQYTDDQIANLIRHSEAKFLIASSKRIPGLRPILSGTICVSSDELELNDNITGPAAEHDVPLQDLAALFYTSGTTDTPKAVMLSHSNLLANLNSIRTLGIIRPSDIFISLLPLHHTYSFTTTMLLPMMAGAGITYPKSLLSVDILDCLKATHATIFVGVPQLFILLHRAISEKLAKHPFFLKLLIGAASRVLFKIRRSTGWNLSKPLFKNMHAHFGGKLRYMVSGGARLDPKVEEDFYRWGFSLLEGYGLTETSPVVCFMTPDSIKFGSVGRSLPGVDIKIIAPDDSGSGEVLVKGDNVTRGYYKEDALTTQAIKDGWFHTGDLGYLDNEGFLFLTGRKKELLILPNGENINPEDIESQFSRSPFIKEIGVLSYNDQLVAIMIPNEDRFREMKITDLRGRLRWEIENYSESLPSYHRIHGFAISKDPLPRTRLGKLQRFQLPGLYANLKGNGTEHRPLETLSSEYSQEAVNRILTYLSQRLKRPVSIKDHLEIDLGLDSLGRLETLMGLQDELGLKMSDEEMMDFFLCNNVEEMLAKVKIYYPELVSREEEDPAEKIVRQGLQVLSEAVKKEVRPEDHLELDLGLDSLERVEVLLNLQEKLGVKMDDDEAMAFFFSNTVQDLIDKLRENVPQTPPPQEGGSLSWPDILSELPDEQLQSRVMTKLPRSVVFVFNAFAHLLQRFFFKLFYRLEVSGLEHLASDGPYLICPNHTTFYDGPIVSAALPFQLFIRTYFLGDRRFFDHWILKPFTRWGRLIPIEFTHNLVIAMQACAYVLKQNKILCFFPEGHRAIENQIDEFKKGVGILVKELNIPVVPVYISGAYEVWPRVHKFPRLFGHIKVTFGQMITPEEMKKSFLSGSYQDVADHIRKQLIVLQKARS